jgi:hypothetical protein
MHVILQASAGPLEALKDEPIKRRKQKIGEIVLDLDILTGPWADVSPFTMLRTRAARRFAVQRCGVSGDSSAMVIHLLTRSNHGLRVDSTWREMG